MTSITEIGASPSWLIKVTEIGAGPSRPIKALKWLPVLVDRQFTEIGASPNRLVSVTEIGASPSKPISVISRATSYWHTPSALSTRLRTCC